MRVAIWPFCSQIDRNRGCHLLSTCASCKQLAFLADKMQKELGWRVTVAVPINSFDSPFQCPVKFVHLPLDNPTQRVHWDTDDLRQLLEDADIFIANHEYLAIPARVMFPKLKIVQQCLVRPDTPLFQVAWDSANLVTTQSDHAAEVIQQQTLTRVSPWKMSFDEDNFKDRAPVARDIDVLFVQRCSPTNYTHHEEFMRCDLSGLRVVYTDVTNWLRTRRPDLEYTTPKTYYDALHRAKVAVSLNDNLCGGLSTREAARAGCTLVCLDAPCYRELRGAHLTDLEHLGSTIRQALLERTSTDVSAESYQASWLRVRGDLVDLHG